MPPTEASDQQPILVPVRLPSHIAHTMPTAMWLAKLLGMSLDVFTVLHPDDDRDFEQRALDAGVIAATGDEPVAVRTRVVISDSPADAFLAECSGRLVCMTTSASPFEHGHYVGSHAAALLSVSDAPVLLVGPRANARCIDRVTDVIAAVSSDDESRSVLPHAAWLAERMGVSMSTLRVDASAGTLYETHFQPVQDDEDHVQVAMPDSVRATLRHDPIDRSGVSDALVDRTRTSVLAVATHARRGLVWIAEGSVAFDSIAKATTPVLAVGPNVAGPLDLEVPGSGQAASASSTGLGTISS